MITAREAAYRSILRWQNDKKFANLEIDSAIKKYDLSGAERSLYTILVYGTIERKITLDYYLSHCSDKPLESLNAEVLSVLRIAAYQVLFLDRIPNHAAVNEAVETAKRHGARGSDKFVNAVLRKLISAREYIKLPEDRIENLSVKYSVPEWIIELWQDSYGEEDCVAILEGMDKPPVITLRANTLVNSKEELYDKLTAANIPCETVVDGVRVLKGISFEDIEEICGNGCYVQDEASQLAVKAVGALPGEFVIDTCACPGGKTFGIAMSMDNTGKVLALDLHKSKLSLVTKGAQRLGIDIVEVSEHNSKNTIEEHIGKADRVLCDVPCSGLGVMAKKPETRYKNREDILRLSEIQYSILTASASYLKNGGRLVYSTCTLNKAENEDVVNRFISENQGYTLDSMTTYYPEAGKSDGFFVSVITKN